MPIFKKSDQQDCNNYRLTSVLSTLANELRNFYKMDFTNFSIKTINNNQYCSRNYRFTSHA